MVEDILRLGNVEGGSDGGVSDCGSRCDAEVCRKTGEDMELGLRLEGVFGDEWLYLIWPNM